MIADLLHKKQLFDWQHPGKKWPWPTHPYTSASPHNNTPQQIKRNHNAESMGGVVGMHSDAVGYIFVFVSSHRDKIVEDSSTGAD